MSNSKVNVDNVTANNLKAIRNITIGADDGYMLIDQNSIIRKGIKIGAKVEDNSIYLNTATAVFNRNILAPDFYSLSDDLSKTSLKNHRHPSRYKDSDRSMQDILTGNLYTGNVKGYGESVKEDYNKNNNL